MGLPDLRPLQAAWLAEVEKRMIAEVERFSPDALARSWFSGATIGADWMPNLFTALRERQATEKADRKKS